MILNQKKVRVFRTQDSGELTQMEQGGAMEGNAPGAMGGRGQGADQGGQMGGRTATNTHDRQSDQGHFEVDLLDAWSKP